jgi:carboxyl-terminal processing protease
VAIVGVDRSSASAAEIVAGALQDHDRAIIVGSASYGKGNAQTLFTLPNGAGIRLTTSRWFTPAGRSINRQPLTDVNGDGRVTAADTVRPVFKTDEGRRVLGGGGIAPDVVAEDSAPSIDVQTLTHAMGAKLPELRNAIADEAQRIKRSGKLTGPMAPISRDMLNDLYANLEQRKIAPARSVFDAAGEWLARALGYEATRARFGADAEFTRRSHDDVALQRAIALVQGARSPREVFAHLDTRKGTAVPASK